jgi:hypothetical protein
MVTLRLYQNLVLSVLVLMCISCRYAKPGVETKSAPDSLRITVTALNLSENLSRNDEVLIIGYLYNDTTMLDEAIFHKRIVLDLEHPSRVLVCKLPRVIETKPLLIVLIELDAELPFPKIDSVLRVSHKAILQEFNKRNYSGIEKYLGDEDVLWIRLIQRLDYTQKNVFRFSGIYKLDKYEYEIQTDPAQKQ